MTASRRHIGWHGGTAAQLQVKGYAALGTTCQSLTCNYANHPYGHTGPDLQLCQCANTDLNFACEPCQPS